MQLFNWTGDRSSALRQYRDCVRILGEELDVSPLDETRELYEAILEERLPPAEQEHTQSPEEKPAEPSRAARTPFAGREAELAALHAAHDAVKTSGRLVVIEGEAGIGKSRLAEEFLAAAGNAGRVILRTRCYEGETALAYAPFVDLLRSAAREERLLSRLGGALLTEASRLAPELASAAGQQPGPLTSPGALSRFFDGICDVLTAAAHGGVIVIEDVQWADEASLEVLAFWLRRLRGRPALLLLTWRGDEVPAAHRLRHILSEAIQRGNGARILLGRLSEAEVGELVAGSGIDAPVGFESRLYEETEGVPFFVAQYIEAAAQGLLEADGRPWQVPEGGRALLQSRLDAVSAQGLQLLAAAAVIGRSFSFEDVRDTSGRSEDETLATLEELLRTGVIREVQGPEAPSPAFDFSHDKLRALVYEQTTLARRRLLHRRVAETLSRGRSRETMALAAKIASHYRQAGEDAAAAAAFRRAAEHALGLHAHAEALRNYHDALALGAERSSEIYEAIGDLQVLEGNYSAALASLERAAATAEPQRLAGIEQKLGGLHHRLGEWPLARRHFAAAIEELGPGAAGGAKARILADWSLTAHASGESQLAAEMAGQALRLAREADDEKALAQAHNLAGMIAAARGDLESAREHLSHSLAIASSLEDGAARIAALNNLALMARRSGDLANAVGLTQEALRLSSQTGDRHREAALRNNLADLYQAQGQAEAAMEQLKQAVAIFAEIGASAGELQPEIWKLVEW